MKPLHLDRDWLNLKYTVEKLSTYDIAKIVGRDPKRIYQKLKDFGIITRPRGHNLSGQDNFMSMNPGATPFKGKKHTDSTKRILSVKASKPKPYLRGKKNGMSGRTGKKNPNYKDGSAPERQKTYASAEWKEILRTIYKRDNYRCMRCGSEKRGPRGIHAHHIKPWAGNPKLRNDMSNIITLCKECHEWVHSSKNTEKEYIG